MAITRCNRIKKEGGLKTARKEETLAEIEKSNDKREMGDIRKRARG